MSLATACSITGHQSGDRSDHQSNAQVDALSENSNAWKWRLPLGFAPPPVPETNPISADKVELGRRLFYDKELSVNGQGSCASCHQQELAFTDGRASAVGVTGELNVRSSMTLVNVAYNATYTWASKELLTLEQQILIPLFGENPVELGLGGREATLVQVLKSDPHYVQLFGRTFPESNNPISTDNLVKALASFVRTIISADSAFDRRMFLDQQDAMSESALRGMQLFFSDSLHCGECHAGRTLAGGQHMNGTTEVELETDFHNTGLYNVDDRNHYPETDAGLRKESQDPNDDGKFRAPTLRNITLTAPYMHDGSIVTLSEVLDHYSAGGRSISRGDNSGNGASNSRKSPLLTGFELNGTDREDLLDFFASLTDYSVLIDSRFAKP